MNQILIKNARIINEGKIITSDIFIEDEIIQEISNSISVKSSSVQIIDAENVIVMEKGKVIEEGAHEVLYDNESAYYEIFNAMANSLNLDKINDTINE